MPTPELGGVCGYGDVQWIDDAHIGVECEYNPSGGSYEVVDAVSGKVEKEFTGLYFSWSPDHQTLAHIGWIIHFASRASQNYCVLFNDKTEHPAIGYPLTGSLGAPQVEWLDNSRLRLKDTRNQSFERVFDVAADPPKLIP